MDANTTSAHWNDAREEAVATADILAASEEHVSSAVFEALCGHTYAAIRYLLTRLPSQDEALSRRCTQALCSVFIGCPRLMVVAHNEVGFDLYIRSLYVHRIHCYMIYLLSTCMYICIYYHP
jgi:hypothetical protein